MRDDDDGMMIFDGLSLCPPPPHGIKSGGGLCEKESDAAAVTLREEKKKFSHRKKRKCGRAVAEISDVSTYVKAFPPIKRMRSRATSVAGRVLKNGQNGKKKNDFFIQKEMTFFRGRVFHSLVIQSRKGKKRERDKIMGCAVDS